MKPGKNRPMTGDVVALLLLADYFPKEEYEALVKKTQDTGRSFWDILLEEKKISEETITKLFAKRLRVERVRLANETIDHSILLPEALARQHCALPLRVEKQKLVVAMANPADLDAIQDIEFHTRKSVQPAIATRSEILAEINRLYAVASSIPELVQDSQDAGELQVFQPDTGALELGEEDARKVAELAPVVRLVNMIILEGLKNLASDIHIEPGENEVRVRNRVDGLMREVMVVPKWLHGGIASRIKILGNMDISERRRPQDGHLRVNFRNMLVDMRVSTLPARDGEKIVLRILGSGKGIPSVTQLGMVESEYERMLTAIAQPQGLILVTGPTGSGKTTTLYSALACKLSPQVNIVTIEDPIEFNLPGVNQVQISPRTGVTFATSLRSILRQDPDVILVGEIRDAETAEIAFHAAMTGHLVLSSLHTNSAVATVSRLIELGIEPVLVSSCLNLVIAQRLARMVCRGCKEAYAPPRKLLERLGLAQEPKAEYVRGKGCKDCGGMGYAGRVGLYEVLSLNPKLQDAINQKPSEEALLKIARSAGMRTLLEDAVKKIKQGQTTVEEVLRVVHVKDEAGATCPNCSAFIRASFTACPYCLTSLRDLCPACGQELKSDWKLCPYCSHVLEGERGGPRLDSIKQ